MSSQLILHLEQDKWVKVMLLVTFSIILSSALVIRVSWKYSHIMIPRIGPTKKWINWITAAGQVSVLAILFLFINLWYQPELINDGTKVYHRTLRTQQKTAILIEYPENAPMLLRPDWIIFEERIALLDRINETASDHFTQNVPNTICGAVNVLKVEEMKSNATRTIGYVNDRINKIGVSLDENYVNHHKLPEKLNKAIRHESVELFHYNEKLHYFLGDASTKLGDWENRVKQRLEDGASGKNFHLKYMLPGVTILAFCLFSVYCSIVYSQVQLVRLGRNFLTILFYALAIEALLLSIYELYSNVSLTCQTGFPQDFPSFKVPPVKGDELPSCTSTGGEIYPEGYVTPVLTALHNFRDFYENKTALLLKELVSADNTFRADMQEFQQVPDSLRTLARTCPNMEVHQEFFDSTLNILNAYFGRFTFAGNSTEFAMNFVHFFTQDMNKAILRTEQQYKSLVKRSNFACDPIYALYRHAHGGACVPLNTVYISHLELAIIGCATILVVLHLVYLRRTDNTQFWRDPRVRWAHKFVTNNIDDDKLTEWKSTNCYDLVNATYKNFYANPKRNRYLNIKCVDESRVVLHNHTTDYIHASWVPIPGTRRRYIATQAPMTNTFDDFWHMIQQENVGVVLQLCGYIENDVRCCDVYFPAKRGMRSVYGHVEVTCLEMRIAPESTGLWQTVWRTFRIADKNDRTKPSRMIHHVFFQNWFDELVPKDNSRIPNLYRWVNSLNGPDNDAPICVMCDTGVGRTGVYITFDYANSLIEQDCFVSMADVNNRVARLRWGVLDAYLEFLFIFMSLISLYIQDGLLYFEDWAVPFKKYDYFLMNRVARMERTRSDKQIEIQYWKMEQNPE